MADDTYAQWYGDRLWQLLPAMYRMLDVPASPGANGPLRELINRIGTQAAVVRRSTDRLWENQSIETCDDWVIPYIGDLVATRLVSCLDAAAQRLDVAKTIYYRRRAGTVGLLEELAADIITRDARVVEFFRRLGRTRHQFDPEIGLIGAWDGTGVTPQPIAEGLVGRYSGTPAGGFAGLRNAFAANNTGSAFDEYAHTADLRAGGTTTGWYNISHLGTFLWWLQAFPIDGATPVANAARTCFTFDPTGRDMPLFAPAQRTAQSFGDNWVTPDEWELPVAIPPGLWYEEPDHLYPDAPTAGNPGAFWVGLLAGSSNERLPRALLSIHPERGRFSFRSGVLPVAPTAGAGLTANYYFGFLSTIGAGGFSDAILSTRAQPAAMVNITGGGSLDAALAAVASDVTLQIGDSLTYPSPTQTLTVPNGSTVVVRGASEERPVLRATTGGAAWTITGNGGSSADGSRTVLVLQGIHFAGGSIHLSGNFDTVSLRMLTLDPGSANPGNPGLATAIDGVQLAPTALVIDGTVTNLTLERCITGPIITSSSGAIQTLSATDSIIQGIPLPVQQASLSFALSLTSGTVSLSRCTVMGPTSTHRLSASESILDSVASVDDPQHGCVRFSAYATGSPLHAPYRCVQVPVAAPLFRTRIFGQPEYTRLRSDADNTIIAPAPGKTILGGAQNGAEMGAFCLEQITLKKRGLTIKYEEYAPSSQQPVFIDAD